MEERQIVYNKAMENIKLVKDELQYEYPKLWYKWNRRIENCEKEIIAYLNDGKYKHIKRIDDLFEPVYYEYQKAVGYNFDDKDQLMEQINWDDLVITMENDPSIYEGIKNSLIHFDLIKKATKRIDGSRAKLVIGTDTKTKVLNINFKKEINWN